MACENGFFPKSNFTVNSETSIELELQTSQIINEIKNIYNPIFQQENKKLFFEVLWDEANLNAYATRDDDNNPTIKVTGGLLRHPLLSSDGIRLILCHEIGHFLGGEPKKPRGRSSIKSWSSAEGQADYYANATCMKKVLTKEIDEKKLDINDSKHLEDINQICNSKLCQKIALASINVAMVYAQIDLFRNELSLIYPDHTTVYHTLYSHPNPQCRLDTFMAALQCEDSEKLEFKINDPISGACKDPTFRRPRCWYYPELN